MGLIKTFPEKLAPYIQFFYSLEEDGTGFNSPLNYLPDGTLEFIINLGSDVFQSQNGTDWTKNPGLMVTGLFRNKTFYRFGTKVHLVGVVFKPGCAHLFMNDSLEHFSSCIYEADSIYKDTECLIEQIGSIPSAKGKHELLEKFFIKKLNNRIDHLIVKKISGAIETIHDCNGVITIPHLFTNSLMSERNFRRKFIEYVGMSPKQYSDIIRVKSFVKRYSLSARSRPDLYLEYGYTDRSHLNKNFKKIAGVYPFDFFQQLSPLGSQFMNLV